jgi:hypothetical protein
MSVPGDMIRDARYLFLATGGRRHDRRARWEPARRLEHLSRFFVERANAGDVDGLVAL